jgi:uncharacterized protein YkwD
MIIDVILVLAIGAGAYFGAKRGGLLIGLELICLFLATTVALATYQLIGSLLGRIITPSTSAASVAFVVVWMVVEVVTALAARAYVLPRLSRHMQPSPGSRLAGGILNALKYSFYIVVGLVTIASLPMSAPDKAAITSPAIPHAILSGAGLAGAWQHSKLGSDVDASLNFYAISADPDSTKRIQLGYTDTHVAVDPTAEAQMLTLLNQARAQQGLKPLVLNIGARRVARAHSQDMFARGYFSHITPEGETPFDRMRAGGVSFGAAGENLALAPTVQLANQGLLASPPHRANIMSTQFRTVGIGIMNGGEYGLMITEDFTD